MTPNSGWRSYWNHVRRATATYHAAAVLLFASANVEPSPLEKEIFRTQPAAEYVSHSDAPYITWLTQKPEYTFLQPGLLGMTTPINGWNVIEYTLSPEMRLVTAVHENAHNIRYVLGADKGLTRAQAENANRDNTEAMLGPKLAPLHARLGRVPE